MSGKRAETVNDDVVITELLPSNSIRTRQSSRPTTEDCFLNDSFFPVTKPMMMLRSYTTNVKSIPDDLA